MKNICFCIQFIYYLKNTKKQNKANPTRTTRTNADEIPTHHKYKSNIYKQWKQTLTIGYLIKYSLKMLGFKFAAITKIRILSKLQGKQRMHNAWKN